MKWNEMKWQKSKYCSHPYFNGCDKKPENSYFLFYTTYSCLILPCTKSVYLILHFRIRSIAFFYFLSGRKISGITHIFVTSVEIRMWTILWLLSSFHHFIVSFHQTRRFRDNFTLVVCTVQDSTKNLFYDYTFVQFNWSTVHLYRLVL